MEGKEYGWYALPDIGDQVAVAFIGGDLRHPVVLGGGWNGTDTPPETNSDGKNHFRGYRSRTGHRLIFDDSDQTKVAFVEQGGQQTIGVGLLAGAGGDSPNAVDEFRPAGAGDKGVAISTMDGTLEVSCPDGTLTIEAGTDVMMTSTSSLDITVGAAMTATGNSVTIAAASTAAFEGANIKVA